jgi:RecA-family ATPase
MTMKKKKTHQPQHPSRSQFNAKTTISKQPIPAETPGASSIKVGSKPDAKIQFVLKKPSDIVKAQAVPSKWIVDGLLRQNRKRVALICGAPHAGKSTLARQLALSVAHGDPFLNRDTVKTKVLYWLSEETDEDIKEDFEKSGMRPDDDDNLVFLTPGSDTSSNYLKELDEVLTNDHEIGLVIIETLDAFLKLDDLGDNSVARRSFERFDKDVLDKHCDRCAFVVLHHFKKSDDQKSNSLSQILGATVIAGSTDAKIYLRQVSDNDTRHYIRIQIRKGLELEATYLNFDETTETSVLGTTLAEEKRESKTTFDVHKATTLRSDIVSAVMSNPGQSRRAVARIVGGKTINTLATINALITEGKITAAGDNELYVPDRSGGSCQ